MPNASTNVMVNGQSIPVPNSGSVSRTITNGNGTTQVDISNHSKVRLVPTIPALRLIFRSTPAHIQRIFTRAIHHGTAKCGRLTAGDL